MEPNLGRSTYDSQQPYSLETQWETEALGIPDRRVRTPPSFPWLCELEIIPTSFVGPSMDQ